MVFEHPVPVRWRDTDALGHVNHGVFLTYLEEGRDAFYLQILGNPEYVVVRIEIDLRAEVFHHDRRLTVRIAVERVGTTSLITRESILNPASDWSPRRGWSRCAGIPMSGSRSRSALTTAPSWRPT